MEIRRGDLVIVDFEPIIGSEQGRIRPAVIIQNDIGNRYSPLTIVAPITSKAFTKEFPTNVILRRDDSKLNKDSIILLNQLRTIDKLRLIKKIGTLNSEIMREVDFAAKISLGLD